MAFFEKYKILGKKGEGTFGTVVKCQDIESGKLFACKILKKSIKDLDQVNRLREVQALRKLSYHPNILQLEEIIYDHRKKQLFLICELMNRNMYELIRDRSKYLSEKRVKSYIYQLLKALDHMHKHGIFHRDVKPENMLISDNHLKLADFGSCRSIRSSRPFTEYISTRWYRSPECLLTSGYYTYKMDIWSVGCVFFEICSLSPLFPGVNEVDQIDRVHSILGTPNTSVLKKLWRHKNRQISFNFPKLQGTGLECIVPSVFANCIDIIYYLCTYDPDERPTAKQALLHPYFENLRALERAKRNMERWTYSERNHEARQQRVRLYTQPIKKAQISLEKEEAESEQFVREKNAQNFHMKERMYSSKDHDAEMFPRISKKFISLSSDNIHQPKTFHKNFNRPSRLPHIMSNHRSKKFADRR